MAESPLTTLARILAGVALVQGRLAHQVLGQLLIAGTNDAAIAAAAVVVAGSTRTRNAAAQVALRTAAPAIAVHALLHGEEERINRLQELVREREKRITARSDKIEERNHTLAATVSALERHNTRLEGQKAILEGEKARLNDELIAERGARDTPAAPTPKNPAAAKKRVTSAKSVGSKKLAKPETPATPKKPGGPTPAKPPRKKPRR